MKSDLNKNYHVYHGDQYNGLRIMGNVYPMISECLETLHDVVSKSLKDYSRVFAFRFDLRFPGHMQADPVESCNSAVSRFIESFKAKIRHNRQSLAKDGVLYHDTKVRFLWVREVGDCARVHYHFVVLLNGHAFNCLGRYQALEGNISSRICEAWASALGEAVEQAKPLVHFPNDPAYCLRRNDSESVSRFFNRASYLCKVQTKQCGHGHHGYGASRK